MDQMLKDQRDQQDTSLTVYKEARNDHLNLKDKVEIIEGAHKKEIDNLHATHQMVQRDQKQKQLQKKKSRRGASQREKRK